VFNLHPSSRQSFRFVGVAETAFVGAKVRRAESKRDDCHKYVAA